MLSLSRQSWMEILAEAWKVYPLEACGLLLAESSNNIGSDLDQSSLGPPYLDPPSLDQPIREFVPILNAAHSSRIFQLDPVGYMKAERAADDAGLEVVGVVHSHTHTAAYPSSTDVAEAIKPLVPPSWHWAIVSLAWGYPELRSFRVNGDETDSLTMAGIVEERVMLKD